MESNSRRSPLCLMVLFTGLLPTVLHAQWPTSTLTSNALVINYGFQARVLTFEDGSSIFAHGITNSVYLTKLDPRGYRAWGQQPAVAHYNDSSGNSGAGAIASDGAGGAIVLWGDLRGAYFDTNGIAHTNALYMQRVDSNGSVRWQAGGVLLVPAYGGGKWGWLVTDGVGGAICVYHESSWWYPGALNYSRLRASRVNRNGEVLWYRTLDSTGDVRLLMYETKVNRAGKFIYIDGYRYFQPSSETYLTRIIDTSGVVPWYSPWLEYHENAAWRDSVLFSATANRVTKMNGDGDTLWSVGVPFTPGSCRFLSSWKSILPEERGGVFCLYVCNDSMPYVSITALLSQHRFHGLSSIAMHPNTIGVFSDGQGGIVVADESGFAQRYDSLGAPVWGNSPVVYRSDPENAYYVNYWGDNNGGIIASMWTPTRGLCVQHTGRYGSPGIVPVHQQQALPVTYALFQNYPNPFNPVTTIEYALPVDAHVTLKVYDVLGREVKTLVNNVRPAGYHQTILDATNLSSSVYFYRLVSEGFSSTKRLLLLK